MERREMAALKLGSHPRLKSRVLRFAVGILYGVMVTPQRIVMKFDSGADYTVIKPNTARLIGINPQVGRPTTIETASGNKIQGRLVPVEFVLPDAQKSEAVWPGEVLVADVAREAIGIHTFLEYFTINELDFNSGTVTFETNNEFDAATGQIRQKT
jgi:hypothetical protein